MKQKQSKKEPMKRSKKIVLLAVVGIIVLVAIITAISSIVNYVRVKTLVDQQNYVSSKLIEMGSYEDGRQLAMMSEQTRSNNTSQTLIVLAAGFSSDIEGGIRTGEYYLTDGTNTLLSETLNVLYGVREASLMNMPDNTGGYMSETIVLSLDEAARNELLAILLKVQKTINVKKTGAAVRCCAGSFRRCDSGGPQQQAGLSRYHRCQCRCRSGSYGLLRPGSSVRMDHRPVRLRRRHDFRAAGGIHRGKNRRFPHHRHPGRCGREQFSGRPFGSPYQPGARCRRSQR